VFFLSSWFILESPYKEFRKKIVQIRVTCLPVGRFVSIRVPRRASREPLFALMNLVIKKHEDNSLRVRFAASNSNQDIPEI